MRNVIRQLVADIAPYDTLEAQHIQSTLGWIDSGAGIFRIAKPDRPPKHLVSYFVLLDDYTGRLMLIDHTKARAWLPPGGHVDPDEHPRGTVIREAKEELGIQAEFSRKYGDRPFFVTVNITKGYGYHTDVSLWYILKGDIRQPLDADTTEIASYRWFTPPEILGAPITDFDPHMHRFVRKLTGLSFL